MNVFWSNVLIELALMFALWIVSVWRRDASIVDPWWSIGFVLIALNTTWQTGFSPGKLLLLGLVVVWGLRLWLHLFIRSIGKPEDVRYQAFRQRFGPDRYWWVSLFQVFLLQGALVVIISAPLQASLSVSGLDDISSWDAVGVVAFVVGFAFEALGDWQLTMFRRNPANKGRVLDTGVWKYTRHPNYFGDALLWWGFWLCGLDGGWDALATVYAPALMTLLLIQVSGVRLLDKHLATTRPGYAEYMARTPGFVPWFPRSSSERRTE
jgi:steroid 5-alpha reductase family enzyme